jgi:hypothetical protein
MMALAIIALRNNYSQDPDPRYIRFLECLAGRTGMSSNECLNRIRLIAQGDSRGFA